MSRTRTGTSHWHVQEVRRQNFMAQARQARRKVIRGSQVELVETSRGSLRGAYISKDEGAPPLTIDAHLHEIHPHSQTGLHRHSWDATLFCMDGAGWTEIAGERIEWKAWDALYLPNWAWHRHGNDGDRPARFVSFSTEPLFENIGIADLEETDATTPIPPRQVPEPDGDDAPLETIEDPYAQRLARLQRHKRRRLATRLHTAYDSLEFDITPRGARTSLLVDPTMGYVTTGLTQALKIYAPGTGETMHAHPGEAWLLCVEGTGHSYIGEEPEGGEDFPWERGDLIAVDHFCWHRHINDHPERTARLVRVHIVDTIGSIARALADPIRLKFEPDWALAQAADIRNVDWPDEQRPV